MTDGGDMEALYFIYSREEGGEWQQVRNSSTPYEDEHEAMFFADTLGMVTGSETRVTRRWATAEEVVD